MRQKRDMKLVSLDEKAAAYRVRDIIAGGLEDDWFELQRLSRTFIKVYGELSPDPAILDFTAEVKWAAGFLKVAAQVIDKDQSVDHRYYTGKIRDMLEEHVHATGLSTTIRLRSIIDPNFADDFESEGKSDEELQEAFVRKSAELKRVTRELVDKNPAQYGRFSERVLEIIRRFEEGQIAAAEGLKEYEDLTGGINDEKGAHAELGMDENAFSILRIMEGMVGEEVDDPKLRVAAVAIGDIYTNTQATQPAWFYMETYRRELKQRVRRVLSDYGVPEAKAIRDAIDEFAEQAYGSVH